MKKIVYISPTKRVRLSQVECIQTQTLKERSSVKIPTKKKRIHLVFASEDKETPSLNRNVQISATSVALEQRSKDISSFSP